MVQGTAGNDRLHGWDSLNGAACFSPAEDHDTLYGGGGADEISGGGNEWLYGEEGWIDFNRARPAGGVDGITDFAVGSDPIRLGARAFGVAKGAFAAAGFVLGTTAVEGMDRILHGRVTGQVWHDADGVGGAVAVLFATVTAADFTGA